MFSSIILCIVYNFYLLELLIPIISLNIKGPKIDVLDSAEIQKITEVRDTLRPVYASSKALCKQTINLHDADKIISFAISKLKNLHSTFSSEFIKNFKQRVLERRSKLNSSMAAFLNSKSTSAIKELDFASDEEVIDASVELHLRLFPDYIQSVSIAESLEIQDLHSAHSLEEMEKELNKILDSDGDIVQNIPLRESLSLLKLSKVKDERIELLGKAILSLQPTSVNPERVFSLSSWFCSKYRNRMTAELLNALILLRYNIEKYT